MLKDLLISKFHCIYNIARHNFSAAPKSSATVSSDPRRSAIRHVYPRRFRRLHCSPLRILFLSTRQTDIRRTPHRTDRENNEENFHLISRPIRRGGWLTTATQYRKLGGGKEICCTCRRVGTRNARSSVLSANRLETRLKTRPRARLS